MKNKGKEQGKFLYEAREGAPFHKEDVQAIGEFIESVGGNKAPEKILKAIKKHPNHVIAKYIEWDKEKAYKQYQIYQVRQIVNHIEAYWNVGHKTVKVRAFHSVKVNPQDEEPVYVSIQTAFSNEYMRKQILSRALSELTNWQERYRIYRELKPMVRAIADFVENSNEKKIKQGARTNG